MDRALLEAALEQFEKEYRKVTHLDTYFGTTSEGILSPYNAVVGKQEAGLEAIGNQIEEKLHPPKEASTDITWAIVFQSFATALEEIDPELVARDLR